MAETWITITSAKVRGALADGEFDAFASAALVPGGSDPVTQAIATIVATVQGAVGASGRNTVGPAGTVPPELEAETLILIMENLSTRLPGGGIVWDELRKNRLAEAKVLLKEVRMGLYQTTTPETASSNAAAADGGDYGGEDLIDFSEIR